MECFFIVCFCYFLRRLKQSDVSSPAHGIQLNAVLIEHARTHENFNVRLIFEPPPKEEYCILLFIVRRSKDVKINVKNLFTAVSPPAVMFWMGIFGLTITIKP